MPGPVVNPVVGPLTQPDFSEAGLRAGRTRELVTGDAGHGHWYEQSSRSGLWTISTPQGGIIMTANMVVSVASHNGIGVYNPTNSGVVVAIQRAVVVIATGTQTTAAGALLWGCVPTSTGITGAGVTTHKNNFTLLANNPQPKARSFDGSVAVTGSAVSNIFRVFGGGPSGTAVAGSNMTFEELCDGDIAIQPDSFIGLFVAAASTILVYASITWAEIPL